MLNIIGDIMYLLSVSFCISTAFIVVFVVMKTVKETTDDKSTAELKCAIVKPLSRCLILGTSGMIIFVVGWLLR